MVLPSSFSYNGLVEGAFGCRPPHNSRIKEVFEDRAAITWDPVQSATGYKIRVRREGAPTWELIFNTGFTHGITFYDLEPCTNYEYILKANCDNGESEFSEVFTFTTIGECIITGSKDLLSESAYQLSLFPNPSFGDVTIKLQTQRSTKGMIRILNSEGQTLVKQPIQSGKALQIATDVLSPGIYWCQFYLENGQYTPGKKLIIQR